MTMFAFLIFAQIESNYEVEQWSVHRRQSSAAASANRMNSAYVELGNRFSNFSIFRYSIFLMNIDSLAFNHLLHWLVSEIDWLSISNQIFIFYD